MYMTLLIVLANQLTSGARCETQS